MRMRRASSSRGEPTPRRSGSAQHRPACPVCGHRETVELGTAGRREVWLCSESSTQFVWPVEDALDATALSRADEPATIARFLRRLAAKPESDLAVLDVACGDGTRLSPFVERGWRCAGVEASASARRDAEQRFGGRVQLVARARDLLPQRFDLVLLINALGQLSDPFPLFFTLFARDAIDPTTRVILATPNASGGASRPDRAGWASDEGDAASVCYSPASLAILLRRLQFRHVAIRGAGSGSRDSTSDDAQPDASALEVSPWLLAEASGSGFREFLRERWVPGSYWELTEYEHVSRYSFARHWASGSRVLDLGCGCGYGVQLLAEVASTVLGVDRSAEAVDWARRTCHAPNASFEIRGDLGRGLDAGAFDLVTCFELIEHLDRDDQAKLLRSISRLLSPGGVALVSTPNPAFTATYGSNPYHLRELDEAVFQAILREVFPQVSLLRQWIRPSILLGETSLPKSSDVAFAALQEGRDVNPPVGYLAICSRHPIGLPVTAFCQFDTGSDTNFRALETDRQLNELRQSLIARTAEREQARRELDLRTGDFDEARRHGERALADTRAWLAKRERDLESEIVARDRALAETRDWLAARERALGAEISELERALTDTRAWLATREHDLESEIGARDRALAETRDWLAARERALGAEISELERALADTRAWLASRERSLEAEIATRDRALAETRDWLATRERDLESRVSIAESEKRELSGARAAAEVRIAELERRLAELERSTLQRAWRLARRLLDSVRGPAGTDPGS